MTNYPKVNFKLSREMEKENIRFFISYKSRSGQDSFLSLVRKYPELHDLREKSKEEQEKIIDHFVKEKYDEMDASLKEDLTKLEPYWDRTTEMFFEGTDRIFDNHPWAVSELTAYITIFLRFRYNLKENYFYIAPNFNVCSWNLTCMHEMLHFHFFDYWEKHFSGKLEKGKLWDLSEIVNVLILREHPFRYLGGQDTVPYPAHEEKYKELIPFWNARKDMKDFIEKAIELM